MYVEPYKINLELFEGPLDLLLHLIKKNDLEIADIPISLVLDQYLDYLDLMKELDIDVAGDFILLASELAHIKSKMLLFEKKDEDEEELDPRADLMARLLEYQKYKRAAEFLSKRPLLNFDTFKRLPEKIEKELVQEEESIEIDPFQLLQVFGKILERAPKEASHEVEAERVSITEKIYEVVALLKEKESILFEELFEEQNTRPQLVISFLAILEMAKLKMVQIYQSDERGQIRVRRKMEVNENFLN